MFRNKVGKSCKVGSKYLNNPIFVYGEISNVNSILYRTAKVSS